MIKKAIIVSIKGTKLTNKEKILLSKEQPWGLILFKRNINSLSQIQNLIIDIRKYAKDKKFPILIDEEGGKVSRLRDILNHNFDAYFFGNLFTLNKKVSVVLYKNYIKSLSSKLRKIGINVNTIPVVDILRKNTNFVIGNRSFSNNKEIVKKFGKTTIKECHINRIISVIKQNAKPVLIDCDINTWNINADDIEKKITKKTKALMVTHIYSFSNDMDKIVKICKKNNIYLIEDSAEVIGLRYKKKPCGSFGDISTFSFYANKQITTGEGGMISTNNPTLRDKCKSLRNLCFGKKNRFNHDDIGWNYRMTNIQASLGINQLKRLNYTVKKKNVCG